LLRVEASLGIAFVSVLIVVVSIVFGFFFFVFFVWLFPEEKVGGSRAVRGVSGGIL